MNATRPKVNGIEALGALLGRARERSAALRRPVLASLTLPYDAPTWPSLDASSECVLWQQPSRDVKMLAVGHAAAIEAAGVNRFGHVREGLTRLLAEAVIGGLPGSAPIALAGFAFDIQEGPEQTPEERWRAFPDGLAVLPRLLFARRDGMTTLTLNALVSPEDNPRRLEDTLLSELDASSRPAPQPEGETLPRLLEDDDAMERWRDGVTGLTERIAAGEAGKVVLARRVTVRKDSPWSLDAVVRRLASRYAECTVFAVKRGEACFLGAAPETLVSLHDGTVRVDCLAGSYPRGATPAEDAAQAEALLASDKDRREHAFVAQAICEALSSVCDDLRVPDAPGVKRFANVQHLHTPIEAHVDSERHVLDLVERLHPTPATAGLPRERSLCLIRRYEDFDRGWYAGPIGWLDARGEGEFAVALRSALVAGCEALLYAGCGIVSGSDPAREYAESSIKLEAMLWALNARR